MHIIFLCLKSVIVSIKNILHTHIYMYIYLRAALAISSCTMLETYL